MLVYMYASGPCRPKASDRQLGGIVGDELTFLLVASAFRELVEDVEVSLISDLANDTVLHISGIPGSSEVS